MNFVDLLIDMKCAVLDDFQLLGNFGHVLWEPIWALLQVCKRKCLTQSNIDLETNMLAYIGMPIVPLFWNYIVSNMIYKRMGSTNSGDVGVSPGHQQANW